MLTKILLKIEFMNSGNCSSGGSYRVNHHPAIIYPFAFGGSFTCFIFIYSGWFFASNWSNSTIVKIKLFSFHRENQEDQEEMETVESLGYRYGKVPNNNDLLIKSFLSPFLVKWTWHTTKIGLCSSFSMWFINLSIFVCLGSQGTPWDAWDAWDERSTSKCGVYWV